ncbi:MAG: class I SAM-dependent methyltransferase [Planctomycetota bacterium]
MSSFAFGLDRPTRGRGRMESYLSKQRSRMADRLIEPGLRSGRLLDYGCGAFPGFLIGTEFAEKHGIDQASMDHLGDRFPDLRLKSFDIENTQELPYADESMAVVTMLAVFEHVPMDDLVVLLEEIGRVLQPGGQFVMTTPAGWTTPVIWALSRLGMISREEAEEHVKTYSHAEIRQTIQRTSLREGEYRKGSFELGLNLWATVKKPGRFEPPTL